MRRAVKIALTAMFASALTLAAGAALFAAGEAQVKHRADKRAITAHQFDDVEARVTTKAEIIAWFGEPQAQDHTQIGEVSSCVWYNHKGALSPLFQFCFDAGGRLLSKTAAGV